MQDITDQQNVAQEISEAISSRAGFGDEFDEVSTLLKTGCFDYKIVILWCSGLFQRLQFHILTF